MQVGGSVDTTSKNAALTVAIGNSAGRPVHYLHELPHAAEERYAELFKQLDRNGKQTPSRTIFTLAICIKCYVPVLVNK